VQTRLSSAGLTNSSHEFVQCRSTDEPAVGWSASKGGLVMSMPLGTSIAPHAAAIGAGAFVAIRQPTVSRSQIRRSISAEVAYLVENVSAMTKTMIDMGDACDERYS
jgi:hypothetical protein